MHALARILLVFAGGAVGAALRALLLALPSAREPHGEAFWLAVVNVVGAFLLGGLLGFLAAPAVATTFRADAFRALLGTGMLGGFTSYSTLVLLALPAGGAGATGALLAVASLVVGVAAAAAGLALGGRAATRAAGRRPPSGPGEGPEGRRP